MKRNPARAVLTGILFCGSAGTEWQDNRTEIGGVRYLRVNRGDTPSGSTESVQHYRWDGDSGWHYFRFDPIRWRIIGLEGGAAGSFTAAFPCRPRRLHPHTEDISRKGHSPGFDRNRSRGHCLPGIPAPAAHISRPGPDLPPVSSVWFRTPPGSAGRRMKRNTRLNFACRTGTSSVFPISRH